MFLPELVKLRLIREDLKGITPKPFKFPEALASDYCYDNVNLRLQIAVMKEDLASLEEFLKCPEDQLMVNTANAHANAALGTAGIQSIWRMFGLSLGYKIPMTFGFIILFPMLKQCWKSYNQVQK